MADFAQQLLLQAQKDYPFIARHNPSVIINENGGEGYAETYPKGETGRPLENGEFSRPKTLPINKIGIEIYQPSKFTHHDLAGEVLHDDPFANQVRDNLAKSWSPKQLEVLKQQAMDYQASIDQGQPEAQALQNSTDAALRGYVLNQWPKEANQQFQYTPKQLQLFQSLQKYMKTPPTRKQMLEQNINTME
jgi:hypothetical protein